jgi:hypothetical protein
MVRRRLPVIRFPEDDDYLKRAHRDLIELRRLTLEGRAKIAQMQDAAYAEAKNAAKLMAQVDAVLARR